MDVSIFLAQAFSIYFVVLSLALLINKTYYQKAAIEMLKDEGESMLTSIVTLILGIILVLFHNLWTADWRVIITVLAWITLIKGVSRLMFPKYLAKCSHVLEKCCVYNTILIILLLLGIYLGYLGFYS